MGRNKALLTLDGDTLINHAIRRLYPQTDHLLISTNAELPTCPEASDIPQLADSQIDVGPLGGILTGLDWVKKHSTNEWLITVAVDTPFFPEDLASRLWQARTSEDRIIAARSGTKAHPTFALWHTSLTGVLVDFITQDNKRRLMGFIEQQPHCYVNFDDSIRNPFNNINTPEDLARLTRAKNSLE